MRSSLKEYEQQSFDEAIEGKSSLHGSEMTSPTETGSGSDGDDAGWWGGIGADFKTLIRDTASGVVNIVHRSAAAVAAELAQLEEDSQNFGYSGKRVHLPWEVMNNQEYHEDRNLQLKIFELSLVESSFVQPYSVADVGMENDAGFVLDEGRIVLIRRLLEIDDRLAAMHARLSGRSDVRETNFWRNYFYHCDQVRKKYLEVVGGITTSPQSQNSLVAVESDCGVADDDSFIRVPSPPASSNSMFSMVVVEKDEWGKGSL